MASFEKAVAKAKESLREQGRLPHAYSVQSRRLLRQVLHKDEEIILEARQSHVESMTPGRIIATNKRLIMVEPSFWGLHSGHDVFTPTNYEIIPYQYVLGITIARGNKLASLKVHHTSGAQEDMRTHSGDEFNGIPLKEAAAMCNFVEEIVEFGPDAPDRVSKVPQLEGESVERGGPREGNEVELEEAREMVTKSGSRFLWLGIEAPDAVARVLGVPKDKVITMAPAELVNDRNSVKQHAADILLSYEGEFAIHVAHLLKRRYGTEIRTLRGGLEGVAKEVRERVDEFK